MSDDGDPQDLAEALDADKLPGDEDAIDRDGTELEPDFPLDVPLGADDDTVTPRMEQVRESLVDRVWREEPDPLAEEQARTADLEDPATGAVGAQERVAPPVGADDELGGPVGRLVERDAEDVLDADLDDEAAAVATDAEGRPDSADMSAEEAALHVTEDPPMGSAGGGYLSGS